jgi:hypothetical protein
MSWGELFVVFFVSHQVGDFVLQTDWQAMHKRGGLGPDATARRALLAHALSYTSAFIPALIWISSRLGWNALVIAAVIGIPHLIQDDGRLLQIYARKVKGLEPASGRTVMLLLDQACHTVALFGAALLVRALL